MSFDTQLFHTKNLVSYCFHSLLARFLVYLLGCLTGTFVGVFLLACVGLGCNTLTTIGMKIFRTSMGKDMVVLFGQEVHHEDMPVCTHLVEGPIVLLQP